MTSRHSPRKMRGHRLSVDVEMLELLGHPALTSKIDRLNTADRVWLRSLSPDVGQYLAGILAGYEPREIAALRDWSAQHLAGIQLLSQAAVLVRYSGA